MTSVLDQLPADLMLSPRSVAGYLAVSGWELESASEVAETWALRENGDLRAQVRLPLDRTYIDFVKRFDAALRRLCLVHDWDSFQLATNVLSTRSDLLYVRADQLIRQDSIPLRQAEQLISGTAKMLTAAAWATIEKRATYAGKKPGIVRSFLDDDVRMGHTQRGSFVITVLTRLDDDEDIGPAEIASGEPDATPAEETARISSGVSPQIESTVPHRDLVAPVDLADSLTLPPFQRRVMATLASALRETARLTSVEHVHSGLSSSVDNGVSSTLCDSLSEMTQFVGLRSLDLKFRWAPAAPNEHPSIEEVSFGRDEIPRIKDISTRLRARPDAERVSVYGRVTKLERADPDEANASLVTIRGVVERNRERAFKVRLEGSDHELAIRAYEQQFPLIVTGDIDRRTRSIVFQGNVTVESMRD